MPEQIAVLDSKRKPDHIGIGQNGRCDGQRPEVPIALPTRQDLGQRHGCKSVSQGGSHKSLDSRFSGRAAARAVHFFSFDSLVSSFFPSSVLASGACLAAFRMSAAGRIIVVSPCGRKLNMPRPPPFSLTERITNTPRTLPSSEKAGEPSVVEVISLPGM